MCEFSIHSVSVGKVVVRAEYIETDNTYFSHHQTREEYKIISNTDIDVKIGFKSGIYSSDALYCSLLIFTYLEGIIISSSLAFSRHISIAYLSGE